MRAYAPPKLTINFDTKGSLAPQTDIYKGYIVLATEDYYPGPIYRDEPPREYGGNSLAGTARSSKKDRHELDVQR